MSSWILIACAMLASDEPTRWSVVCAGDTQQVWQWMVDEPEAWLGRGATLKLEAGHAFQSQDLEGWSELLLAYEPQRVLVTQLTHAAEGGAVAKWSLIYRLEPLSPTRTQVSIQLTGAADEDKSLGEAMEARVKRLQGKFVDRTEEKADRVLELLQQLVGKTWIAEQADQEQPLLVREQWEHAPDQTSLLAKSWLGSNQGLYFRSATQVWKEPSSTGDGAVRFQNLDASGAVARGAILHAGKNRLQWEWHSMDPIGFPRLYRVDMRWKGSDEYQFRALQRMDSGEWVERIDLTFRRVDQVPAKFLKRAQQ